VNDKQARAEQRKAERGLCPVGVAEVLEVWVQQVAAAMRAAGVMEQLTIQQARAWRSLSQEPPEWMLAPMSQAAIRAARREARTQGRAIEEEHRMLVLSEDVAKRLLAGRSVRGSDRELIASDLALGAVKDLVGADGDASYLKDLDRAALRGAGVVAEGRSTWFLRYGGGR
jgi:hypothetical protein